MVCAGRADAYGTLFERHLNAAYHHARQFTRDHAQAEDLVVCLEVHTARVFLEEPADITAHRAVLGRLDEISLGIEESRRLFLRLANECETAEAGAVPGS